MINIKISNKLKEKCPNTTVASIEAEVSVRDGDEHLWEIINDKCEEIKNNIKENYL